MAQITQNSKGKRSTFELLFIRLDVFVDCRPSFGQKMVAVPSTERCQIEPTQPVAEPRKSTSASVVMLQVNGDGAMVVCKPMSNSPNASVAPCSGEVECRVEMQVCVPRRTLSGEGRTREMKNKGRDLINRCSKWYLEAEKQIH